MKLVHGACVGVCVLGALVVFCSDAVAGGAHAGRQTTRPTVVEQSKALARVGGGLSTVKYGATEAEKGFEKQVTEESLNLWADNPMPPAQGTTVTPEEEAKKKAEREAAVAKVKAYTLAGQAGKYVGWFGILREEKTEGGKREWLVQHCHFDGLTDSHLQVVSLYGAGDFRVVVNGSDAPVAKLSLVRVFGKVSTGKDGVAEIQAEFVRAWDWGLFTFMTYGEEKSNAAWRALRKVDADDAYDPAPTPAYYERVLGARK